ncbi:MAG: uroporphyrinogen-III synthase [Frankiales bacterium]|nr:Uroporphyrinogen synthase [Frankiales bacterium]MCW2707325.1 Uroporphyrinogen synthase [Frankiales bacterium]MDX6266074.1 uroporphyrinogen-III synthase [Frankiales bacterium]
MEVVAHGHTLARENGHWLVDGVVVELSERQSAVLTALISARGKVLSRDDLLREAWEASADAHAVEMTVARLRSALGPARHVVQTVVKRGYRLAAAEG